MADKPIEVIAGILAKTSQKAPNSAFHKVFSKIARSSSDSGAVLDAGWNAMQQADPRLAQAVTKLPPQLAQQAVLQYTNAIRMGKEAEAASMATQAVRDGFSSLAQPQQTTGRLLSGGNPYAISDAASFDQYLAKPAQQSPVQNLAAIGSSIMKNSVKSPQAPANPYQSVKDAYAKYNEASKTEYDKALLWDTPAPKDLTIPENWSLPGSSNTQVQPTGLIRQTSGSR